MHGVARRSFVDAMRTAHAVGEEPLLRGVLPSDPTVKPPRHRDAAYLPLHFDPTEDAPPWPTVGLCYRHTVQLVNAMRSWGEPPDGYDWVPDGLVGCDTLRP